MVYISSKVLQCQRLTEELSQFWFLNHSHLHELLLSVLQSEKVSYERFRAWLFLNKDAFTLSRWLLTGGVCVTLTDDSDTPTFYQTLAGVTHRKFPFLSRPNTCNR